MSLPPIVYEDDTMIAFDKPSGFAVSTGRWGGGGTAGLLAEIQAKLGRQVASAHRLDAETSGVLLCAKTKVALDFLSGQFQSKTVGRKYLALAAILDPERAMKVIAPVRAPGGGLPAEFTVDLALGEDELRPGRMRVFRRRGGRPGLTEFRVLESFGRFAWLECRPVTGRTHQVRVHLAAAGAPVLNDALYGDPSVQLLLSDLKRRYKGRDEERPLVARLALHAGEMTVTHPVTREPLTLAAPLPREFDVALKYLRRYAGLAKR